MFGFLYDPLSLALWRYPVPYASCLVSCSVAWMCSLQLRLSWCILLKGALLVLLFSANCSSACLACDWLPFVRCPSKHVHCKIDRDWLPCNHLDGQFNYWASAHWLISGTTMYQLCNWWLCHSTHLLPCDKFHIYTSDAFLSYKITPFTLSMHFQPLLTMHSWSFATQGA